MLCRSNYLEDLPASADDSTGHSLKVTEGANTFTDQDSGLHTYLDFRPSPVVSFCTHIFNGCLFICNMRMYIYVFFVLFFSLSCAISVQEAFGTKQDAVNHT